MSSYRICTNCRKPLNGWNFFHHNISGKEFCDEICCNEYFPSRRLPSLGETKIKPKAELKLYDTQGSLTEVIDIY